MSNIYIILDKGALDNDLSKNYKLVGEGVVILLWQAPIAIINRLCGNLPTKTQPNTEFGTFLKIFEDLVEILL